MFYSPVPEFQAQTPTPEIEHDPSYTGLTLADYSVLIDIYNPTSTNHERSKTHLKELESLGHHFEVKTIETTPDKFETALIIEEAMGDNASKSVIHVRTGDGSNGGIVRAAIGRGAALWQVNAGFANNLSRSAFPFRHRSSPEKVLRLGKIVRTKAISWEITDPNGNRIASDLSADEFGLGNMANAQLGREDDKHRAMLKEAWSATGIKKPIKLAKTLRRTAQAGSAAIDATPAFKVKFGTADPEAEEDLRPEVSFNELTLSNIGHIAWIGRIRGIDLVNKKMSMITDSYRTKLGPRLFYLRLYSIGVKGEDVPDGQPLEFDLITKANAQGSGNPFGVDPNSHFRIERTKEDLLVVTTRRHP